MRMIRRWRRRLPRAVRQKILLADRRTAVTSSLRLPPTACRAAPQTFTQRLRLFFTPSFWRCLPCRSRAPRALKSGARNDAAASHAGRPPDAAASCHAAAMLFARTPLRERRRTCRAAHVCSAPRRCRALMARLLTGLAARDVGVAYVAVHACRHA